MQNRNPYAAPRTNVTLGDSTVEDYGEIRLFSPRGRIGRVRYIGYSIGLGLLTWIVVGIVAAIAAAIDQSAFLLVIGLGYVAVLTVQFFLNIQRAHDMNATGWLSLLWLLPFGVLVFWFWPGTPGENDYGKRPPPNTTGVIVLTCLAPILIVGILAAIAIPAYQDYTIRAQISEGLNLAAAPKAAVAESFLRSGVVPADRLAVGLPADPTQTAGRYVASVNIARGTILVAYGSNANAAIAGSVLAIRPYVMPDRSVSWRCGQGPMPNGIAMDAGASSFTTDIIPQYLPSACRPL